MRVTNISIMPVDNGWIVNTEYERGYAERDSKTTTMVFATEEGVLSQLNTTLTLHKIAVDNSNRGY